MSSARQALTIVGQIAGASFGPLGSAIGGVIGGEIGGLIDGPPEGPRLDDLSAPQIQFGGKIGRLYGGPKWFEVSPLWMSAKTEHAEQVGGKGGDSGSTQFSYSVDMLLRVCESREGTPCEVIAVTGVEVDGELVWTALADASAESIAASQAQEIWFDMDVMLGAETQAPWSVYEAARGVGNAEAFRGYLTVGFTTFFLAGGGQPRRIRIQAITSGTQDLLTAKTRLQSYIDADDTSDISAYAQGSGTLSGSGASISGGAFVAEGALGAQTGRLVYADSEYLQANGTDPITVEFFYTTDLYGGGTPHVYFEYVSNAGLYSSSFYRYGADSTGAYFQDAGGTHTVSPTLLGSGVRRHIRFILGGTAYGIAVYLDGVLTYSTPAGGGPLPANSNGGRVTLGNPVGDNQDDFSIDEFAVRFYEMNTSNFTPPANIDPPDGLSERWTPTPVLLRDILEYEAERCAPLAAASIDFSAAAGLEVDCHVAVGSAAEAIQPLLTRFWFDLYSADKLYLVRRGGAVEQTIPFAWSGAGVDGRSDPFAGLLRTNDVEVPRKKAITYADILKDGETDTRTGDRESVGSDVDTLSLNLNMRPTEAQGLADTATWDARIAGHTATVRLGARHGLKLQPGSVITLVDHKGNTYRVLVRRAVWTRWVWECEVRLDDAAVLQAAGIAVDLDQRALTVVEPPEATLYVLDIPLLRPQDDGPGEYVAVTQTGRFRGVDLWKSPDNVTYTRMVEVQQRATAGVVDSALAAFSGWGWDNASVLTVTLDDGAGGTLSSASKTAVEASRSLNLAAVGVHGRWELLQFATATLLTGSTYALSGLLRNLVGTEWASGDHAAGDSFVLLQPAGLARVPGTVADLGQTRYYKAVPRGRSRDSVTAESIVSEQQGLLPYAPTDVWNDAGTVRWNRRSRLEGAIGLDPPLGETSERYDAELYDGVTLEDSAAGLASAAWTPGTDPAGLAVRVYQLSDLVGRGHVAEKDIA